MNPSLRSKLREDLRADAARLTALADRHGTPLLVLRPQLVARRSESWRNGCRDSGCTMRSRRRRIR